MCECGHYSADPCIESVKEGTIAAVAITFSSTKLIHRIVQWCFYLVLLRYVYSNFTNN